MAQNEIARAIVDLDGSMAGEELKKLETRARELRSELVKLGANNDLGGFRQKEKELKLVNGQMKGLKTSTDAVTQVLKNLNGSSLNELTRAQRQLNIEIKASHRNTKEEVAALNEKIGSLKRVNAAISKVKIESQMAMKTQQSWLSGAAQGFNKYFAILSAGIATLTGVVFSIKAFIQGNVELSDSMADVMKTTGLTKNEVRELYSEFKNFNTRTPRKELLALAEEAGRLGMKGKKDIMGFVEVANQIKIALGDELGGNAEEAIREVGKLTNVYKVAEKYGVDFRQSMLMVGSALNQVAASGQSEAGYLIDLTKRLAGVSSQAGISVQDVIGYAAALDEMGQTSEISSTTLNKIIVNMFKDVKTYADLAKMSAGDFYNLLNTDANEALLAVLNGLNGNNAGLAVMATKLDGLGLDGARSVQILAALAGNIDLVRKYQDISNESLEKGTSLTEEYNVKNNNLAGNVEKIGRALRATFVNSGINNALENIVGYFAKWVEIPVSRTMDEERIKINALVIELSNANTEGERKKKIWEELKSMQPGILEGLEQENLNYSQLQLNLRKYNEEMIRKISLQKLGEKKNELADTLSDKDIQAVKQTMVLESAMAKVVDRVRAAGSPLADAMSDVLASSSSIGDKFKQLNEYGIQFNMGLSTGLTDLYSMNDAYELMLEADKQRLDAQKAFDDEFAIYQEMYNRIMGTSAPPVAGASPTAPTDNKGGGYTPEVDKKLQELLDKQDAFRLQLIIESKSLIEQEEIAYQERLKNAGIFGKKKEDLTGKYLEAYYILEQQHNANILKINDQAYNDDILKQKELFDRITVNRQIAHNNELAALGNDEKAKSEAKRKFEELEIERQQRFLGSLLVQLQATLDKELLGGIDEKLLSDEQLAQLRLKIEALKLLLSELGIDLSALQNPDLGEGGSEGTSLGKKATNVDIFGMTNQQWTDIATNIENANLSLQDTIDLVEAIANVWGEYYDIKNKQEQQDLMNFQASTDQKKQFLQNQLDRGIISQDQYHKGVAKLDAELDKKKKELAIKQAKREKEMALMSAIVNTAAAIVSALATQPIWLGIALAILVGILGGVQIATIASTPIPQFESGKYDVIGNKDGKKYSAGVLDSPGTGLVNSPAILVGEKPEIIIDPYTTRNMQVNFPHLIEAIGAVHEGRLPQFASGQYPGSGTGGTLKEPSSPDKLNNILAGLTAQMGTFSGQIERLSDRLDKGIGAKLVADGDYIETHNKVSEDYDELHKQVNLRS